MKGPRTDGGSSDWRLTRRAQPCGRRKATSRHTIVKCRKPEIRNPNSFQREKSSPVKVKEWEWPGSLHQQHNEAISSRLWVKMIPSLKFCFLLDDPLAMETSSNMEGCRHLTSCIPFLVKLRKRTCSIWMRECIRTRARDPGNIPQKVKATGSPRLIKGIPG